MNEAGAGRTVLRKVAVLAAAVFAVVAAPLAMQAPGAQSIQAFAAKGDEAIRAAPFAFAVWGPLYAGVLAAGVYQAWPRPADPALVRRLGWPAAVAFFAIGLWAVAAELGWELITPAIILVGPFALVAGLFECVRDLPRADRWTARLWVLPLAALAGWLTVASPLNIVGVLLARGWLPPRAPVQVFAYAAIGAVAVIGLVVAARTRLFAYPLLIAWGLVGVTVAAMDDHPPQALAAMAAALVLLIGGWATARRPADPAFGG